MRQGQRKTPSKVRRKEEEEEEKVEIQAAPPTQLFTPASIQARRSLFPESLQELQPDKKKSFEN